MRFSYNRKTPQLLKAFNFSYFEELMFGQESIWKFSSPEGKLSRRYHCQKTGCDCKIYFANLMIAFPA